MNASPRSRRLAITLAFALLASTFEAPLPLHSVQAATASQVAVTASVLNVRAGPGTNYAIISQVKRDTRLTVLKQQGGWLQVRLPNGRTGWVSGQYVRPVSATPAPAQGSPGQPAAPSSQTVAVTASVLNVRSGPGTTYAIVTKVKRDTRLTVQKQQAGWLQVRLPNGRTGWVSGQYVRPVSATPAPSSGSSGQQAAPSSQTVEVTASVLNVRAGPGTNYAIISQVKRGTRLTVLKQQGGWLQIRLSNGRTGWVSGQYVRPVSATPAPGSATTPSAKTATVTASRLNVRSGPGTQYAVIGSLPNGTRVTVLEERTGW
ncbi:MAG TPA: SH3 domain-containing protein, partial [Calditerricola sp.]